MPIYNLTAYDLRGRVLAVYSDRVHANSFQTLERSKTWRELWKDRRVDTVTVAGPRSVRNYFSPERYVVISSY